MRSFENVLEVKPTNLIALLGKVSQQPSLLLASDQFRL